MLLLYKNGSVFPNSEKLSLVAECQFQKTRKHPILTHMHILLVKFNATDHLSSLRSDKTFF